MFIASIETDLFYVYGIMRSASYLNNYRSQCNFNVKECFGDILTKVFTYSERRLLSGHCSGDYGRYSESRWSAKKVHSQLTAGYGSVKGALAA